MKAWYQNARGRKEEVLEFEAGRKNEPSEFPSFPFVSFLKRHSNGRFHQVNVTNDLRSKHISDMDVESTTTHIFCVIQKKIK